jgi:hypothetical protein
VLSLCLEQREVGGETLEEDFVLCHVVLADSAAGRFRSWRHYPPPITTMDFYLSSGQNTVSRGPTEYN